MSSYSMIQGDALATLRAMEITGLELAGAVAIALSLWALREYDRAL